MPIRVWFHTQLCRFILSGLFFSISFGIINLGSDKSEAAEFNNPALVTTLIQNTVLALNQANLSGNYTVLRDLASPQFGAVTTSAQLAIIFREHRKAKLDMSPVVLFQPQLSQPPQLTNAGTLHVVGFYPTKPLQINFNLTYQIVQGQWRILRISVFPTKAEKVAKADSRNKQLSKAKILPRTKPEKKINK